MRNLRKISQLSVIACLSYGLIACTSTPTQNDKKPIAISSDKQRSNEKQTNTVQNQLAEIEASYLQTQNIAQRNSRLLQLADSYLYPADVESNVVANNAFGNNSFGNKNTANNLTQNTSIECNKANQIVKHIQTSLVTQDNLSHANIIKAECQLRALIQLDERANKAPYLELIEAWLSRAPVEPEASASSASTSVESVVAQRLTPSLYWRKNEAQAKLFAMQDNYAAALQTLLSLYNLDGNSARTLFISDTLFISEQYNNLVWQWFSFLEGTARNLIVRQFPVLRSYKIILDTIEDKTINDAMRQQAIMQWIQNNPSDPIAQNLPMQVQQYLQLKVDKNNASTQKIAVLLPLSGRLDGQGEAIKQGILAAYYQNLMNTNSSSVDVQTARNTARAAAEIGDNGNAGQLTTSIEFIDTGSLPTLNKNITSESLQDYHVVIGPLLRSHIEQMADFTLSSQTRLLLNQLSDTERVESQNQQNNQVLASYALAPEHEARELVTLMKAQNINNPIVVSDGSSITDRMVIAFKEAWQNASLSTTEEFESATGTVSTQVDNAMSKANIQHITYSDNRSMRIGITSALDVLQSQRRISQLTNLADEQVYSVTRNRRDVDAFVVFARPDDLELINPIIEASISLFSNEQVPVFATSFSYNHKQSKNSLRDLKNLVFTDMPWVLPASREKPLAQTIDQLFNEPPSTFLRLFAFGFDALALADNLAQLQTFEHLSIDGIGGTLSLQNNQVKRELASISITDADIEAQ